jgi:hypothetical protein
MPIVKDALHAGGSASSAGGPATAPSGGGASAARAQSSEISGAESAGARAAPDPTTRREGAATAPATTPTTTTPTTGPAPGAAPAPSADPNAARWTRIETLLNGSPLGRAALQFKRDNNVRVNYAAGTGSFYSGRAMTLDTTETPEDSALTFVHEMNHARYDIERRSANHNIGSLTREAYVSGMLDEEVEGVILAIEAKGEIVAGGTAVAARPPLEGAYTRAYQAAITGGKNATEAKADGRTAVRAAFVNGTVVTSNTHESYPVYYGKGWDNAHPAGGGGK